MRNFDIPKQYESNLIGKIKHINASKRTKDFAPIRLSFGRIEFLLPRTFGFCFGVQNAVEVIYKTLEEHKNSNVYILSEIIHNPHVNADLLRRGVSFLFDTQGNALIDLEQIKKEDIVIVPAFGTTTEIYDMLKHKGVYIKQFDTTCPFVKKVWNKSAFLGKNGYTTIIHGKSNHEETRATFSQAKQYGHCVVVKDMNEARILGDIILEKLPADCFYETFKNKYSKGFEPVRDLQKIGVVNQTTMLSEETKSIMHELEKVFEKKYGLNYTTHFYDTKDTLCYATNDNQSSAKELLKEDVDLAIVIGGQNSSNTINLVKLYQNNFQTYFIQSDEDIMCPNSILNYNIDCKQKQQTEDFLPVKKDTIKIILSSGASCPDIIMDNVLFKLLALIAHNV